MMPRNHKYQLTKNISQVMVSPTVSLHDGLYELSRTLVKPLLNLPSPSSLSSRRFLILRGSLALNCTMPQSISSLVTLF